MKKLTSVMAISILLAAILACSTGTKTTETNTAKSEPNTTKSDTNTTKSESKQTDIKIDSDKSNTNSSKTETKTAGGDLAGTYAVNGSSLDGKPYQGEMVVTNRDQVYQLSWKVGSDTYDGVGIQSGNTIAAAYSTGEDGKGCGAVIYKINGGDNSLDGKWGEWGVNQSGTEKATPAGELKDDTGKFNVTGTNADGSPYKGTMTVTKSGNDVYQFAWDIGKKYIGTGVKMGDYLAAGSGSKQCGFVIYEIKDGNLEGKWGVPGSNQLGSEKATRK
jgi:hypothetical protein